MDKRTDNSVLRVSSADSRDKWDPNNLQIIARGDSLIDSYATRHKLWRASSSTVSIIAGGKGFLATDRKGHGTWICEC